MNRIIYLFILLFLSATSQLHARCIGFKVDTLAWEQFEQGLPDQWKTPEGSDGASWNINSGSIGYYLNAGEENWLYIDDEQNNQVGKAFFETASYDFSAYNGFLQLGFDMTFQDFADSGLVRIEVYHENEWVILLEESDDFFGRIEVDIQQFVSESMKFRFTYDDEGAWGWGMGIDNFLVTGRASQCGNDICDYGETPESCPGDCPGVAKESSSWVSIGRNLYGEEVDYTRFQGSTSCDDCTEKVELGFEFSFYEENHTTAFINTNGNMTFQESFLAFTPTPFCLEGPKMIAPFFADIDLQGGGEIWYYSDPDGHYFIASWKEVAYFGCGKDCEQTNTFQIILTDGTIRNIGNKILPKGTSIVFQYDDLQWTTGNSSEGSRGFGGKPATVGLNQGNGSSCQNYGTFNQPGYGYYGNIEDMSCLPSAVDHLDYQTLTFDGITGEDVVSEGELKLSLIEADQSNVIRLETDLIKGIDFFVIERSKDGVNFDELTSIDVLDGVNGVPGQYEYIDENPFEGRNHYRIIEVKSDGDLEYSEIQHLERVNVPGTISSTRFELTQVGPNPFKDHLNISFTSPQFAPVKYMLVDMSGRVMKQGNIQAQEGINAMRLELSDLPSAIYVLTIYQGEEKDYRQLVKR